MALVVCLGGAAGVSRRGGLQCCSGELPQSLVGFFVVALVIVISGVTVDVSGAHRQCLNDGGVVHSPSPMCVW
jgi:hypothetical protein